MAPDLLGSVVDVYLVKGSDELLRYTIELYSDHEIKLLFGGKQKEDHHQQGCICSYITSFFF